MKIFNVNPFADISMDTKDKQLPKIQVPTKKRSFKLSKSQFKLPNLQLDFTAKQKDKASSKQVSNREDAKMKQRKAFQDGIMEDIEKKLKTVLEEQSYAHCGLEQESDEFEKQINKNRQMIKNHKNKKNNRMGQKSLLQLPIKSFGINADGDNLGQAPNRAVQGQNKKSFMRNGSKGKLPDALRIGNIKNKGYLKNRNKVESLYEKRVREYRQDSETNKFSIQKKLQILREGAVQQDQKNQQMVLSSSKYDRLSENQNSLNVRNQIQKILKNIEQVSDRKKQYSSKPKQDQCNSKQQDQYMSTQNQQSHKKLIKFEKTDKKYTDVDRKGSKQENLFENIHQILVKSNGKKGQDGQNIKLPQYYPIKIKTPSLSKFSHNHYTPTKLYKQKQYSSSNKISNFPDSLTQIQKISLKKHQNSLQSLKEINLERENIAMRKKNLLSKIKQLEEKIEAERPEDLQCIKKIQQKSKATINMLSRRNFPNSAAIRQKCQVLGEKLQKNPSLTEQEGESKTIQQQDEQKMIKNENMDDKSRQRKELCSKVDKTDFEMETEKVDRYFQNNQKNMKTYVENQETLLILQSIFTNPCKHRKQP